MQSQVIDRGEPELAETSSTATIIETPPREQITYTPPGSVPPPVRQAPERPRRPSRYLLIALALALVVAASFVGGIIGARLVPAQTTTTTGQKVTLSASVADLQQAVENVSQGVQPSVVEVTSHSGPQESAASGIVLTADGYIVTNDHVVNGYSTYTVTLSEGTVLSARLIGEAAQDDLALLKVDVTGLTPIAFADSSSVVVGQFVVALGSPLGLTNTAMLGTVSALNRTASESPDGPATELVGLIQVNMALNPGNSGGALIDLQGRLVGVPTLRAGSLTDETDIDGIGFAIPANRVTYVANQLVQYKRLVNSNQGHLGIQGQDLTPQLAKAEGLSVERGVFVTGFTNAVSGTSPAQRAGVQIGDVITAVNGVAIAGNDDLAGAILTRTPDTRVTLTIMRGSQQQTISLALGERPVSA